MGEWLCRSTYFWWRLLYLSGKSLPVPIGWDVGVYKKYSLHGVNLMYCESVCTIVEIVYGNGL
jgi:hypothetical protein